MKKFTALYYSRNASGQLCDRFIWFEAASLAAAKRHGQAMLETNERLVHVEVASEGTNCPRELGDVK